MRAMAHDRLMSRAMMAVTDNGTGSGGAPEVIFQTAVPSAAAAGMRMRPANQMLAFRRDCTDHPRATRTSPLMRTSSRKSAASAKRDADPMMDATVTSMTSPMALRIVTRAMIRLVDGDSISSAASPVPGGEPS